MTLLDALRCQEQASISPVEPSVTDKEYYVPEALKRNLEGIALTIKNIQDFGEMGDRNFLLSGPDLKVQSALISHPQGTTFTGYTATVKAWKSTVYDFPPGKTYSILEKGEFQGEDGNIVEMPTKDVFNDWEATLVKRTGSDRLKDYHLSLYPLKEKVA